MVERFSNDETAQASDARRSKDEAASKTSKSDSINPNEALVLALLAACSDGDSSGFRKQLEQQIELIEEEVADCCGRKRETVEDALGELVGVHDSVSRSEADIRKAKKNIENSIKECEHGATDLRAKVRKKANAEKACTIIRRTKRMVYLASRVQGMLVERRLHAAVELFKLYKLQMEKGSDEGMLKNLLPRQEAVEKDIAMHAKRLLHSWIRAERSTRIKIGQYALLLDERSANYAARSRTMWLPQINEETRSRRWAHLPLEEPQSIRSETEPPTISTRDSSDYHEQSSSTSESPPYLPARALVSSFLAYRDLGLHKDFQVEYRKLRRAELDAELDMPYSGAPNENWEEAVYAICGFFMNELTVAKRFTHLERISLPRSELNELWKVAESIIGKILKAQESGDAEGAQNRNESAQTMRERVAGLTARYRLPFSSSVSFATRWKDLE